MLKGMQWMAAVLFASVLLIGCGGGDDLTAANSTFDRQFIDMMVPHHEGAVEMAKVAQERGEHPEIKSLASDIIAAQNAEISQMKSWRRQWFGSDQTPPMDQMPVLPGMESMPMMDMMKSIEDLKTAQPFDKAFIDDMISHHQMAITAAQIARQQGRHSEIRTLASKIIEAQKREITKMQSWKAQWYPNG
jgi:uncharacterized protein (DUF305 family)